MTSLGRRELVETQAERIVLTDEGRRLCPEVLDQYNALVGRFLTLSDPARPSVLAVGVSRDERTIRTARGAIDRPP